ncbi:MAG: sugar ABC transporter ATP-binding protein [Acidimicrobiales bacterium]
MKVPSSATLDAFDGAGVAAARTADGEPSLPHFELRGVSKHFGATIALDRVSVTLRQGRVHAFVGENGAGKSTLGKIVGGVHAPDGGVLVLRGEPVRFRSPIDALAHGVASIAQELAIVPELTAEENVFLGAEPRRGPYVQRRQLRRRYEALCETAGFGVPPGAVVGSMRVAEQQKVEILRALARDAELLVLDEPSASLGRDDVAKLRLLIPTLRARGITLVLVSHFLEEVLELADDVSVLRDGHLVRTGPAATESEESLVEAMLGRSLNLSLLERRPPAPDAPALLSVRELRAHGVNGVSFEVRAGEVVALAGLVGAGRTEVAQAIVGTRRATGGDVLVDGVPLPRRTPRRLLVRGLAMIPESRKEEGLLLDRPVRENAALSVLPSLSRLGYVRRGLERRSVSQVMTRLDVRASGADAGTRTLSGGNQQKLLFARVILAAPSVLIADEPTRGVDVGARRSIHELLLELAGEGKGVLLISSDTEEVLAVSHRILVMQGGRIVAELDGATATEEDLVAASLLERERPAS